MKNLLIAVTMSLFSVAAVGESNPTAVHIQRTMKMMEESTAEKPAHVRVLFYGQSITAQPWTFQIVDMLKKQYPTVKFTFDKFSIGGFSSDSLYRTALTDLYPYYPDLLFFHVYGSFEKYEEIVSKTKQLTAADVVLWSSHLSKGMNLAEESKGPNSRAKTIEKIAKRWNCMYIDLHDKWCKMLNENNYAITNVLTDSIHLNKIGISHYGKFVKEEIVRIPNAKSIPGVSGEITEIPVDSSVVTKRVDGGYDIVFTGNRLVAEFDGTGTKDACGEVLIDGKTVGSVRDSWISTRVTTWPMWMPVIRHIDFTSSPVEENWTLTFLEGTKPDGSAVHYRVDGSVTGFDGEGWSTNDFASISGRAIIPKSDWGWPWQISYQNNVNEARNKKLISEGKPPLKKITADPGRKLTWKTKSVNENPFGITESGVRKTLVQGCEIGRHTLSIVPKNGAKLGIVKFISYSPGAAALNTEKIHK